MTSAFLGFLSEGRVAHLPHGLSRPHCFAILVSMKKSFERARTLYTGAK